MKLSVVPSGQINACGGAHRLQAPASNPGKKFFSLGACPRIGQKDAGGVPPPAAIHSAKMKDFAFSDRLPGNKGPDGLFIMGKINQAVRERTRGQAPSFPRVLFMPFFNLVNI